MQPDYVVQQSQALGLLGGTAEVKTGLATQSSGLGDATAADGAVADLSGGIGQSDTSTLLATGDAAVPTDASASTDEVATTQIAPTDIAVTAATVDAGQTASPDAAAQGDGGTMAQPDSGAVQASSIDSGGGSQDTSEAVVAAPDGGIAASDPSSADATSSTSSVTDGDVGTDNGVSAATPDSPVAADGVEGATPSDTSGSQPDATIASDVTEPASTTVDSSSDTPVDTAVSNASSDSPAAPSVPVAGPEMAAGRLDSLSPSGWLADLGLSGSDIADVWLTYGEQVAMTSLQSDPTDQTIEPTDLVAAALGEGMPLPGVAGSSALCGLSVPSAPSPILDACPDAVPGLPTATPTPGSDVVWPTETPTAPPPTPTPLPPSDAVGPTETPVLIPTPDANCTPITTDQGWSPTCGSTLGGITAANGVSRATRDPTGAPPLATLTVAEPSPTPVIQPTAARPTGPEGFQAVEQAAAQGSVGAQRLLEAVQYFGQENVAAINVPYTVSELGSSDLDIVLYGGDVVEVGGPSKISNAATFGTQLSRLAEYATLESVNAYFLYAPGTPQQIIDMAIRTLGASNVIKLPR